MIGEGALLADWPAPDNVRALTTLRVGAGLSLPPYDRFNLGSRCGDDPRHVRANRRLLSEGLAGVSGEPKWLQQVHGQAVLRFDSAWLAQELESPEPVADAAVTDCAGTVLSILTADCLPVLFCSRDGKEIGAAHAGWRGLADGVLEATVQAMRSPPDQVLAWLGPAAGPQAYEIGDEVRKAFVERDPAATLAFTGTRVGHWLVDLYLLARQRLARAGVGAVYGGGLCTISDVQRFYSYRRDGRTGRMASLIWMSTD